MNHNSARILVVDDDTDFCAAIQAIFQSTQIDVVTVENAAKAVIAFQKDKFDLYLIDGMLPDSTGIELLEQHQNLFQMDKVVFISNYFREKKVSKHLREKLGVKLILRKPMSPVQLKYNLEITLERLRKSDTIPKKTDVVPGLAELTKMYRKGLPDKLTELERLGNETSDEGRGADLIRHVHNLSGSASTYGFSAIGQAAAKLEAHLAKIDIADFNMTVPQFIDLKKQLQAAIELNHV